MISSNGFDPSNIPVPLRSPRQWVNWRREVDDNGKLTKRPYNPRNGHLSSVTDPDKWSDLDTAIRSRGARQLDGIGYVLTKDQGIVFIDLDHCINSNGEIAPWAQDVLDQMQSYAEISPSGDGIHILISGNLPDDAKHTRSMGDDGKGKIEIYDNVRYFTVTGDRLQGYRDDNPLAIEARQRELDLLYANLFLPPTPSEQKNTGVHRLPFSDRELIDRAMAAKNGNKFRRLWDGDISEYDGDDSRADEALLCMLAFLDQSGCGAYGCSVPAIRTTA
jgi:primase-polymerase (primpol)-like protein